MKHENRLPPFERKPEVLAKLGLSRSTLHLRIKQKLFVPPVSLGGRAVGWPVNETNAVIGAMIAGKSHEEIKSLVARLIAERKTKYQ